TALEHQMLYDTVQRLFAEKTQLLKELEETKQQLLHLAHHDPLTKLVNKSLFEDRLMSAKSRAQRAQRKCGLIYLEIDQLQQINDNLGSRQGDKLLQEFADRL